MLYELQPQYIVLYDVDLEFLREVEVYRAQFPERRVQVYVLMYDRSIDEQRYVMAVSKERNAFERLIKERAVRTSAPSPRMGARARWFLGLTRAPPPADPTRGVGQSMAVRRDQDGRHGRPTEEDLTLVSTRRGGGRFVVPKQSKVRGLSTAEPPAVVVLRRAPERPGRGVRGRRSDCGRHARVSLEPARHPRRMRRHDRAGDAGDWRLRARARDLRRAQVHQRPHLVVGLGPPVRGPAATPREHASGALSARVAVTASRVVAAAPRRYSQAEAMCAHYAYPVLLIEFEATKAFALQSTGDLKDDISVNAISSKIVLLTLHFPKLKIIWSQSPHQTAEIFQELKVWRHADRGGATDARARSRERRGRWRCLRPHSGRLRSRTRPWRRRWASTRSWSAPPTTPCPTYAPRGA